MAPSLTLNRRVRPLVEALVADAAALRLGVSRGAGGALIVDAGIASPGGIEAGRRGAEICLGGRGAGGLAPAGGGQPAPTHPPAPTPRPGLACPSHHD